jgi:ABC-type lipoprotein release transport system permease subunit
VGLVARNLQRRPRRTLLTLVGLSLGAASYMALVGAAQGFLRQYRELARFCGADIVVHQAGATSPWSSGLLPAQVTALVGVPGVKNVARLGLGKTQLFGSPYFLLFGVDPAEALAPRLQIVKGRGLRAGASDVLLGELAARRLALAPGGELELRRRRLLIAGVFRTGHPIMDAGAVLDLHLVQGLFNLGENVNLVFLELDDPAQRPQVLATLAARFHDLESRAWESWTLAFGQMGLVAAFARLLAILAVLIAALGVSNVMHMAVSERTQELAILRAIGWRRVRVAALVLREGAALSVLGGLCGTPLAAAVFWLLGSEYVVSVTTGGFIPLRLPLSAAVEGLAVTVLAGVLGTLPPLLRALRLRPAEALHMPT